MKFVGENKTVTTTWQNHQLWSEQSHDPQTVFAFPTHPLHRHHPAQVMNPNRQQVSLPLFWFGNIHKKGLQIHASTPVSWVGNLMLFPKRTMTCFQLMIVKMRSGKKQGCIGGSKGRTTRSNEQIFQLGTLPCQCLRMDCGPSQFSQSTGQTT